MNHRQKPMICLFLMLPLLGLCAKTPPAQAMDRPNFVFVFADDWGRFASAYAQADGPGSPNDVVKTPHIDQIARDGVLFRHAFVNAPSCTPCRSSLLSGQYFWRTGRGGILHGAVWDPEIPSFPLLLRDAGYHIGKSFKVWSPGKPVDAPFDGQRHAYEAAGKRFNNFSENVTRLVKAGETVEAAKNQLLDEVSQNFAAFLRDRKPAAPFFYWFGPTLVHRKWTRGSGKAIWGIDPEQLKGKLPWFLPDVPEVREDFADYLGEIQALDAGVGRLLKSLEESGEADRTIVVVSGDHGPPGFTHGKCNLYDFGVAVTLAIRGPGVARGRVVDPAVSLVDLAPTFLELGGIAPPAQMTGRSLLPALRPNRQVFVVTPTQGWVLSGRERHVANARDGNLPYPQRAIRTAEYLYIVNFEPDRWPMGNPYHLDRAGLPEFDEVAENTYATFMDMDASPTKAWLVVHRDEPRWRRYFEMAFDRRPREELYVLANDKDQMNNVAGDPAFEVVRKELNARLMAELKRTGDPRVVDGGKLYEEPPFTGPPPSDER